MILLYVIGYALVFYLFYVVGITTLGAWPTLPWPARILLGWTVLVAVLMDIPFNVFVATILFYDWPQEAMFTQRLERYKRLADCRARRVAVWICQNLLDPFQLGGHCR